ncbi:aminoalcoholphosphotransferase [Histoplasma capsulatum var. duboisii H88]|uniref:Aminoalcoholphosphotransferase n=1 Tax=Ajellomyces capsulatus (strain H88) TaxID=544711 RepID=A0A8A1LN66_AJEC8|nr:aminoalcoholphosphotransferase [Histoplasma capsulatum var. duboisii H88]
MSQQCGDGQALNTRGRSCCHSPLPSSPLLTSLASYLSFPFSKQKDIFLQTKRLYPTPQKKLPPPITNTYLIYL